MTLCGCISRIERFPTRRKSNLDPRGDGPFQVIKRINNNAYQIDLPGDYGVHATFNVADLSPYRDDDFEPPFHDSGTNQDLERENDVNLEDLQPDITLHGDGPITRAKAKKMSSALYSILRHMFTYVTSPWMSTQEQAKEDPRLVTLLAHEILG